MSAKDCWGVSFHYDLKGCDMNLITNKDKLKFWVKALVADIEMKAFGEPLIEHFGEPNSNKEGYTVVQLIETSNIIAHCNDHTGESYIDIFTCKLVDNLEQRIEQNLFKWFNPIHITYQTLYRKA